MNYKKLLPYLFIIISLTPFYFSLLQPMQTSGHSSIVDYCRLKELHHCIQNGYFYPRWFPDFFFGYGYPLFNYYAPLSYYIAQFFSIFDISLLYSIKFGYIWGIILSGFGMYLLGSFYWGRLGGVFSALLYCYTPYHLLDIYVRSNLAESTAFIFPPFILWSLNKLLKEETKIKFFFLGSISYAGLILTHNISAFIFTPIIIFYLFLLYWQSKKDKKFLLFGSLLLLNGIGLSCFFWCPAIFEKGYVQIEENMTKGLFFYGNHFVYLKQLIIPSWGFGSSILGPNDEMSFQLGIVNIFSLLLGIILINFFRKKNYDLYILLLSLYLITFLAIFFMLDSSYFIWDNLPLIKFIQFPWRFLMVTTFTTSLIGGGIIHFIYKVKGARFAYLSFFILSFLTLLFTISYTRPRFVYINLKENEVKVIDKIKELNLSEGEITIQDFLTIPNIIRNGVTTTAKYDYLPIWVKEVPETYEDEKVIFNKENALISEYQENLLSYKFNILAKEKVELFLRIFWFPGWICKIDEKFVKTYPSPKTGMLAFTVESGNHKVEISFNNTKLRYYSEIISFIFLGITICYSIFKIIDN